jgi:uncharacterized membrane protein
MTHGPYGQPYGQPYGGGHPPQYGAPQHGQGAPPPYAPPQHHAPSGYGRPPRAEPYPPYDAYYAEAPPAAPGGGPVTDEDERWAVPAYVGMFVSGFVAPAIVLLLKGRTSSFARFHAVQALNLFVAVFAGTSTALLLAYFKGPGWLPLVLAILAADCFFVIRAAIGANRCEWYRLPVLVAWRIFR